MNLAKLKITREQLKKVVASQLFAVIVGILILCLILFNRYIFKGFTYYFDDQTSDSLRVCLPAYYSLYDKLANGSLFYSMDMGIGNSFLAHSPIIFDPYTYLLFIFGKSHIEGMMIVYIIAKIVSAGVALYFFLRQFHLNRYAVLAACIAYAFNGYMIIMGQNYAFMNTVIYLPLILLVVEQFIKNKKILPYVIIQALTALYFYYFFYMIAFAVVVYFVIRYAAHDRLLSKGFVLCALRLAALSALALGISAFFVLPLLYQTLNTVRTEGSITERMSLLDPAMLATFLGRLLHPDFLGEWNLYKDIWRPAYGGWWGDYFEIASFSSVLAVLVTPQLYKFSHKKQRMQILLLGGITLAVMLFPVFAFVLNALKDVTFRFSFIFSFITSIAVAFGIHRIIEVKRVDKVLLLSTIIAAFALSWATFAWAIKHHADDPRYQYFSYDQIITTFTVAARVLLAMIVFLGAAFAIRKFEVLRKPVVIVAIIICCFAVELQGAYAPWLNERTNVYNQMQANGIGFFDDSYDLIQRLKQQDSSFYRLEKNFDSVVCLVGSNNDSMVQGYHGLKLYSSLNNVNYLRFLQDMGIYCGWALNDFEGWGMKPRDVQGQQLNYINGVGKRYDLMSFLGVKYYIVNDDEQLPPYFELLEEYEGLKLYKNNNYLPLALVKSQYMLYDDFVDLDNQKKDDLILRYSIVSSAADVKYAVPAQGISDLSQQQRSDISKQYRDAVEVSMISDGRYKLTVSAASNGIITFTIPYQRGWIVKIDGQSVDTYKADLGLLSADIEAGQHEVEIIYRAEFFNLGVGVSVMSLLMAAALVWWQCRAQKNKEGALS